MDSKESIQPLCAYDSTPSVYWGYRVFSKGQRVKEGSESERGRYVTHFVGHTSLCAIVPHINTLEFFQHHSRPSPLTLRL